MTRVTPFLMFNDQIEAAIAFYTTTFPDSEIKAVTRARTDGPITSAEFVVGGQSFMGYNGGPHFKFSEGISLFVSCEDQTTVDEYWNKLVSAGATPSRVVGSPITSGSRGRSFRSVSSNSSATRIHRRYRP